MYSFTGENDQFIISNGVIVLSDNNEIFSGGDLRGKGKFSDNITCYSTTFYVLSGDEKEVLLSNSVNDMTGNKISVFGDLGQISGDGNVSELENSLYFELVTTDQDGNERCREGGQEHKFMRVNQ